MTTPPLEDTFVDIIGKAQAGLGLGKDELLQLAGISASALEEVLGGKPEPAALPAIARALGLHAPALAESADGSWRPAPVRMEGLFQQTTPFFDMTVNAYVVWDPASRVAAVFDSGADAAPLVRFLREQSLTLGKIFLTHTHGDHVADLETLVEATGAPVFCNALEPFPGAELFEPGAIFPMGALSIETRLTRGHSPGGTTYVIAGLAKPLAIVGDALFAGSMGGARSDYQTAIHGIRSAIFQLPEETVLAPGHGPLTTLAEEKIHNPFFAV